MQTNTGLIIQSRGNNQKIYFCELIKYYSDNLLILQILSHLQAPLTEQVGILEKQVLVLKKNQ